MFEPHGRVIPILALATAGCLWGTGFFFGKIALTEMPVAAMILFRLAFACIGLLPIIFWDRPHFDRHEWGWVFVASVLGVPVLYLVQFKGLSLTTVSHASLMVGTLPMLLAIAAVVVLGRAVALRRLACACGLDGWRCFDRVVEQDRFQRRARNHSW